MPVRTRVRWAFIYTFKALVTRSSCIEATLADAPIHVYSESSVLSGVVGAHHSLPAIEEQMRARAYLDNSRGASSFRICMGKKNFQPIRGPTSPSGFRRVPSTRPTLVAVRLRFQMTFDFSGTARPSGSR